MAKRNPWKKPAWLREKIAMDKSMRGDVEDDDWFLKDMYPIKKRRLLKMIKKSKKFIRDMFLVILIVSFVGCTMPWTSGWYKDKATTYFEQNPNRTKYKENVLDGILTQGMNEKEADYAIRIEWDGSAIESHRGVYGEFSGAYWFVGWYKTVYNSSVFVADYIVFFENGKVTGWLDI